MYGADRGHRPDGVAAAGPRRPDHPDAIGVADPRRARCASTESVDDRPGVGELVYTGPNVMLGYAEAAGRPRARPRRSTSCAPATSPARSTASSRSSADATGTRQGLRPAPRPRPPSSAACAPTSTARRAVVADRPRRPRLRSRPGAAARARAALVDRPLRRTPRTRCGSPSCRRCRSPSSGKADYAALVARCATLVDAAGARRTAHRPPRRHRPRRRTSACSAAPTPPTRDSLRRPRRRLAVLRRARDPARRPLPGGLPAGLAHPQHRRARAPRGGRRRPPAPTRGRGRRRATRLDTTVALRALAILFVVASHVDLRRPRGRRPPAPRRSPASTSRASSSPRRRRPHPAAARPRRPRPARRPRRCCGSARVALVLGSYDLTTVLFVREVGQRLGVGRPVAALVPRVARVAHRSPPWP